MVGLPKIARTRTARSMTAHELSAAMPVPDLEPCMNGEINAAALFYVLREFFVVLAFFLPIEGWKEHVHHYKPKRKLALFFRFCLIWGLGQDKVDLLNRKVSLLFPEGGETVIMKVQFQLQLMVIYRMESQNCLHLFSKVIFVQSRKLICFFFGWASICLCLLCLFA